MPERINLIPRKAVMPPQVACVSDEKQTPHAQLDRGYLKGSNTDRAIRTAIVQCSHCFQKDACALQPEIGAYLGARRTVVGGVVVTHTDSEIQEAQFGESNFRFIPGQIPKKPAEIMLYVRAMIRGDQTPELSQKHQRTIPLIMSILEIDDFPRVDVERVITETASQLVADDTFPITSVVNTAQTIFADARSLNEAHIVGDVVTLAMHQPAAYYIDQDASQRAQGVNRRIAREPVAVGREFLEAIREPDAQDEKRKTQGPADLPALEGRTEKTPRGDEGITRPIDTEIEITQPADVFREETAEDMAEGIITDVAGGLTEEERKYKISRHLRSAYLPHLTKEQERRMHSHMHTAGEITLYLLTDAEFVNDMEPKDRSNWLRIFRYAKNFSDILIAANYGFLVNRAKIYAGQLLARDIPFSNLLEAGEEGMRRAAEDYDPDYVTDAGRNVTFMDYSRRWMQHYMQIEIAKQNGIGRYLLEKLQDAIYLKYAFSESVGRNPTLSELREQLVFNSDLTLSGRDRVIAFFENHYTQYYERALSLDAPLTEDQRGRSLYDVVADKTDSVDEEKETLMDSLSRLSPMQRLVITALTGMNEDERIFTVEELAGSVGITVAEVNRYLLEAYEHFRADEELALYRKERTGPKTDLTKRPETSEKVVFTHEPEPSEKVTTVKIEPVEPFAPVDDPTLPRKERLAILYRQLKPGREIAQTLGISLSLYGRLLAELKETTGLPARSELLQTLSERIKPLYTQRRLPGEIADMLSLPVAIVTSRIKQMRKELQLPTRRELRRLLLIELTQAGLTPGQMAEQTGYGEIYIREELQYLAREGRITSLQERIHRTHEDRKSQVAQLKSEGLETSEIASILGLSPSTVTSFVSLLYKEGVLVSPQERDRLEREKTPSKNVAIVKAYLDTHPKTNLFAHVA